MAFWTDAALDPKRQFKFYVSFAGISSNVPHWAIKGVNKPTITIGETAHKYLDKNFYFPGRVEWNVVKFTMVDPIGAEGIDVSKSLITIIKSAGYGWNDSAVADSANLTTTSKLLSSSFLGAVNIIQINSLGATVETWSLKNAWIKSVNFGALSYESEDLVNVELELRYDYADLS